MFNEGEWLSWCVGGIGGGERPVSRYIVADTMEQYEIAARLMPLIMLG